MQVTLLKMMDEFQPYIYIFFILFDLVFRYFIPSCNLTDSIMVWVYYSRSSLIVNSPTKVAVIINDF